MQPASKINKEPKKTKHLQNIANMIKKSHASLYKNIQPNHQHNTLTSLTIKSLYPNVDIRCESVTAAIHPSLPASLSPSFFFSLSAGAACPFSCSLSSLRLSVTPPRSVAAAV
jgi:hypothetical protein